MLQFLTNTNNPNLTNAEAYIFVKFGLFVFVLQQYFVIRILTTDLVLRRPETSATDDHI